MISLDINAKCADCGNHAGLNSVKVFGRTLCTSCRMKSLTYNTNKENSEEYKELGYDEPKINESSLTSFQKLQFIKYIANETGISIEKSEEFLKSIDETEKNKLINTFMEQKGILADQVSPKNIKTNAIEKLGIIKDSSLPMCPKCKSQAISVNTQKFGVGKAFAGVVLTGAVGLLAGGIGRNNVKLTCLSCGNKWKP